MRNLTSALALCILTAGAVAADSQTQSRQIVVTGRGEVSATPDMATVSLGVLAEDTQAARAMQAMSEALRAVTQRLDQAGIAPRDIQTGGLSLQPLWTQDPVPGQRPRVTGYQASSMLSVQVRALDGLGAVLDAAIADGANQLNGLGFGVQDPAPLLAQARQKAVADAVATAALYAQAAGVELGPVQSISEPDAQMPKPYMAERSAMAMDAGVPVSQGEITVAAQVTIVFAIAD